MTTLDPRPRLDGGIGIGRRAETWRERFSAYLALTKPRVVELLLVSTVPTMILAAHGMPSLLTVLYTLIGGSLAAGSANAFNMYLDRDIDVVMNRTANRPLVTGRITPRAALVFAFALGAIAVAQLALTVNVLSAMLALGAIAFYVVVYTMVLKRRTPQNIVWGGLAGCMPVLIGWAAVRDSLSWEPFVLFFVIFLWTPPHYWPLSMRFRRDYQAPTCRCSRWSRTTCGWAATSSATAGRWSPCRCCWRPPPGCSTR